MASREELLKMLKKVLPEDSFAIQIVYLDEIAGRLAEISQTLQETQRLQAPVQHVLRFPERYQTITIPAGQSATVYLLQVRSPEWVAVMTEVANGPTNLPWASVYFTWLIDHEPREPAIMRYSVAPITDPKPERLVAYKEIRWVGHNEDDEEHDFEVVCDGYFIERKLFGKIMAFSQAYKER